MQTIALLGVTGSLGRAMGRLLGAAGQPYRAVSRSYLGLKVRFGTYPLAEQVLWEPEQPASVLAALTGVETAVYLVGMPLWEFEKHLPLTSRVLEAARTAGVQRLLLISSNWAYGAPWADCVTEAHPLSPQTRKGRIRLEQEQMVLAADGLATAVLRIGDFYGPYVEASYLWSAFKAAKNGAHAQLMSPVDTPHEFVFVPDAARVALTMLESQGIWGHAWNLGGPGVTTLRSMTEAIFAEAGTPPNYEVTPPWKMRLVAMLNPYVREMREMRYLLESPVMLDDTALGDALGGLVKTPYAEGIRKTLPTVRVGR